MQTNPIKQIQSLYDIISVNISSKNGLKIIYYQFIQIYINHKQFMESIMEQLFFFYKFQQFILLTPSSDICYFSVFQQDFNHINTLLYPLFIQFFFLIDDNIQIMPSLTKLVLFSLALIIVPTIYSQQLSPGSCLEFSGGLCIKCDIQTHLDQDQGLCYTNIPGCIKHLNGTACSECAPQISTLSGLICVPIGNESLKRINIIKESDPGAQYGQAGFIPTTFQSVKSLPSFIALNTFIRRGQYSHFISRSSNPIYSIHYYLVDKQYTYKILYQGSGGGLFLCIADVPPNLNVKLRSLTPITQGSVVDYCDDYDVSTKCIRCGKGRHLQQGKCYLNYGGCVKYIENICTQCMEYFFLVQNRCISDCLSVSDARSILYYSEGRNVSSLQSYYGVSISQFYYAVTIKNTTNTIVQTVSTPLANDFSNNAGSNADTSVTSATSTISSTSTTSTNFSSNANNIPPVSTFNLTVPSILTLDGQGAVTTATATTTTTTTTTNISFTQGQTSSGGSVTLDPNCSKYDTNGNCITCAFLYFKNKSNICQMVNPICASYDETNGDCTSCYPGYTLNEGDCSVNT